MSIGAVGLFDLQQHVASRPHRIDRLGLVPSHHPQQTGNRLHTAEVHFTGTTSRLDLESLVEQEFGDEIEELKTRAETVVTDKISEELGVEVDSLDNIEDTLKEELTNRAAGELLKLLGGN